MATNSAEAQKMLDAAKRTGKKLTIGYQNRNTPEAQFLKAEADKGTFGEIYYAKATALRRRAVPTWAYSSTNTSRAAVRLSTSVRTRSTSRYG